MLFTRTGTAAAAKAIEMPHCTRCCGGTELQAQLEEASRMQLLLLLLMMMMLLVMMMLIVMMLMQCGRRVCIERIQMAAEYTGR